MLPNSLCDFRVALSPLCQTSELLNLMDVNFAGVPRGKLQFANPINLRAVFTFRLLHEHRMLPVGRLFR
jgi:hypothetical protein